MAESLEQHYRRLLGLDEPWLVEPVDLDLANQRVEIRLAIRRGVKLACPECTALRGLYDQGPERVWRHLDTMQFETVLKARVPRIHCPQHGVKSVEVPWAGKHSRFTSIFEAFALRVLEASTTVKAAACLLRLDCHSLQQIMERAVQRGLQRRALEPVRRVGIDEKSFGCGQSYVSLMSDLEAGRVLKVVPDRTTGACQALWQRLGPAQGQSIEAVALDMWEPFLKATAAAAPQAQIVHDKFHVSKHLKEAGDEVRRTSIVNCVPKVRTASVERSISGYETPRTGTRSSKRSLPGYVTPDSRSPRPGTSRNCSASSGAAWMQRKRWPSSSAGTVGRVAADSIRSITWLGCSRHLDHFLAGNELLISPDCLIDEGLLRAGDYDEGRPLSKNTVDYNAVIAFKYKVLKKAWSSFSALRRPALRLDYEEFCLNQAHWSDDYALFRALKTRHGGAYYLDWPAEFVRREPASLARARRELAELIEQGRFAQFLLFRQGKRLREYARAAGVHLIGDLPFFVSPDSSDVWANPELFLLDENRRPRFVAGVPPDYFSAQGQLWGNPVYDWEALRRSGYRWCIDRLRALLAHVDLVRLDHFRGFSAAWHVPAGATTAQPGQWVPGPGAGFFSAVKKELGTLPFIAEDLGVITPDVRALRDQFHLPGTRILQFAFDGHPDNPYLPHNYIPNTVVYTGTHDNATTRGWFEALPEEQRRNVWNYLKRPAGNSDEVTWELIRLAWSSVAGLAMVPLQDLLNLGAEARMNLPGSAEGNWRWRCTEEMLSMPVWDRLRALTTASNRNSSVN